jgi:hypothetical protein
VSRTWEGNKAHGRIGCCSGWQRPDGSTDSSAEQGLEDGCSSGRIGMTGTWQRGSVETVTTERQARSASTRFGAGKFALGFGRAARLGVPTGALDGRFDGRTRFGGRDLRFGGGRVHTAATGLFGGPSDGSQAAASLSSESRRTNQPLAAVSSGVVANAPRKRRLRPLERSGDAR